MKEFGVSSPRSCDASVRFELHGHDASPGLEHRRWRAVGPAVAPDLRGGVDHAGALERRHVVKPAAPLALQIQSLEPEEKGRSDSEYAFFPLSLSLFFSFPYFISTTFPSGAVMIHVQFDRWKYWLGWTGDWMTVWLVTLPPQLWRLNLTRSFPGYRTTTNMK